MIGKLLNAYLSRMTEIVFAHGGTVDKYIGDAVMAIFGAPFPGDNDPLNAVKCALQMREAFEQMVEETSDIDDMENMRVHIGINTGNVVVGTVGSTLRMEYTALGDTVNIASRLEALSRAGQIVLGESTANAVKGEVPVLPLGNVRLKGKKSPSMFLRWRTPDSPGALPRPFVRKRLTDPAFVAGHLVFLRAPRRFPVAAGWRRPAGVRPSPRW